MLFSVALFSPRLVCRPQASITASMYSLRYWGIWTIVIMFVMETYQ